MIKVHDIEMRFGKKIVLDQMNFSIKRGTKVAFVGDSGCGKSTLARIMVDLLKPSAGKILINGEPLAKMNRKSKAQQIQMVFQHPISSFNPKKKIVSQLDEVIRLNHLKVDLDIYLKKFGLESVLLDRYPFQISGGEAQRLSIIRALLLEPELLILDEPTSMLDVSTQAEVFQYLLEYQEKQNVTMILISHDLELVSKVCDEVYIINEGRIIESDTVETVLSRPRCVYTKELVDSFKYFY